MSHIPSDDFLWLAVAKHDSFIVKRNGVVLSRHPLSVRSVHSRASSGIANSKAVGVKVNAAGNIVVSHKATSAGKAVQPNKSVVSVEIKNTHRRRVASAITAIVGSNAGRQDLVKASLNRYARINRSVSGGVSK
jgi:large subunit ribosomal protein L28e